MYNPLKGKTDDTHAAYKATWSPNCTAVGGQGRLYGHDAEIGSNCLLLTFRPSTKPRSTAAPCAIDAALVCRMWTSLTKAEAAGWQVPLCLHEGHVPDQVNHSVAVPPFVVIPGHQLQHKYAILENVSWQPRPMQLDC